MQWLRERASERLYGTFQVGVELHGRTQYSLRHFFATEIARKIPEKHVARFLGQRTFRKEYDHREARDFLAQASDVIGEVRRIF